MDGDHGLFAPVVSHPAWNASKPRGDHVAEHQQQQVGVADLNRGVFGGPVVLFDDGDAWSSGRRRTTPSTGELAEREPLGPGAELGARVSPHGFAFLTPSRARPAARRPSRATVLGLA